MTITIRLLFAIWKRSTMFTIQERTGMMFRPPHTLPVYYIRVGERSSNELNGRPLLLMIHSGNGGVHFYNVLALRNRYSVQSSSPIGIIQSVK